MKTPHFSFASTAVLILLSLGVLGSRSFAAAPFLLNYPYGLTVDGKGNLYVANTNSNQVLIYNPAHVQQTAKTISNKVAAPSGLAFDLNGNLWVANQNTNSITQYSPSGVLNTNTVLTAGVTNPQALAVDGVNTLWVNMGFTALAAYPAYFPFPVFETASSTYTGIAAWQNYLWYGTNSNDFRVGIATFMTQTVSGATVSEPTCFAMAHDKVGNLYCGNQDASLTVMTPNGTVKTIATLGFFPTGLAFDPTHGFIYVANGSGNSIAVYNNNGTLLATIK